MHEIVDMDEADTCLAALFARAEAGEEIVIARAGKPVVRLVRVEPSPPQRRLGEAKGLVKIGPDFDGLPSDHIAHFR